mmetsp:Transcript_49320/g.159862  ORF Transcript_49320/g.159862 Transcript_49320/m.159862 type:complete len:294 (-) Transcript_49320:131-1012(-)
MRVARAAGHALGAPRHVVLPRGAEQQRRARRLAQPDGRVVGGDVRLHVEAELVHEDQRPVGPRDLLLRVQQRPAMVARPLPAPIVADVARRVPMLDEVGAWPRSAGLAAAAEARGEAAAHVGRLRSRMVAERARGLTKGLGRDGADALVRHAARRGRRGHLVEEDAHGRARRAQRGRAADGPPRVRAARIRDAHVRGEEDLACGLEALVVGEDGLGARRGGVVHRVRAVDHLGEARCHGALEQARVRRVGRRERRARLRPRHKPDGALAPGRDVHRLAVPRVNLHRRHLQVGW